MDLTFKAGLPYPSDVLLISLIGALKKRLAAISIAIFALSPGTALAASGEGYTVVS